MRKKLDYIDAVAASVILKVSRSQVNRRAASGEIPFVTKAPGVRGAYMFDRAVIEKIADAERLSAERSTPVASLISSEHVS